MTRIALGSALLLLLTGCAATPPDIEAQTRLLDAAQVRPLDAGRDEAFHAVLSAIIDAGYTLRLSDPEGGLISATMEQPPAPGEEVLFRVSSFGMAGAPQTPCWISALVTELSSDRMAVRLVQHGGWHPRTSEEIMVLAQRQILMKSPRR